MRLLRQITTYFSKKGQDSTQPAASLSNSFEIITEDILEGCLREQFLVLGEEQEQEGLQNMYVKDYLLIGKKCEGTVLSVQRWQQVLHSADLSQLSKKDLYFSIFQGIDYRIRKDVWQLLANAQQMKATTKLSFLQLTDPSRLPKPHLDTIDKDVARTAQLTDSLPELRQILIAYANLSETSYIQGMNIIGGVLLRLLKMDNDKELQGHLVVEGELPERVFWVMVGVMKWKNWEEVFAQEFCGLKRMVGVLRALMLQYIPEVLKRIEGLEWDLFIFAQYYVTICLSHCPLELAPMILDLFLLDGEKVVHSLLVRMLAINQHKILAFQDESLLMKYLKADMLADTYQRLLKDRATAQKLEDFQINFLRTTP